MTLYRIVDEHPYLDRYEEYPGLTLDEAAHKMDDLTGVGADVILADYDEGCARCTTKPMARAGQLEVSADGDNWRWIECPDCHGTGKRAEPWGWTDEETGREVTMRREIS